MRHGPGILKFTYFIPGLWRGGFHGQYEYRWAEEDEVADTTGAQRIRAYHFDGDVGGIPDRPTTNRGTSNIRSSTNNLNTAKNYASDEGWIGVYSPHSCSREEKDREDRHRNFYPQKWPARTTRNTEPEIPAVPALPNNSGGAYDGMGWPIFSGFGPTRMRGRRRNSRPSEEVRHRFYEAVWGFRVIIRSRIVCDGHVPRGQMGMSITQTRRVSHVIAFPCYHSALLGAVSVGIRTLGLQRGRRGGVFPI